MNQNVKSKLTRLLKRTWKYGLFMVLGLAVIIAYWFFTSKPQETKAGWWNDSWSYRKAIVINHDLVPAHQTDFPVLVSFTDASLGGHAQDDADDFVFVNTNGTKLKHEVEKYASSTGEFVGWVKTDISSTTDSVIYLYYGNAGVGDQSDAVNVWDENYIMVQHLNESSGNHQDSTRNNHNSDDISVNEQAASTGLVNGADDFSDNLDYVRLPDHADWDLTGSYTIEAWVKGADNDTSNQTVVGRLSGGDWDYALMANLPSNDRPACYNDSDGVGGLVANVDVNNNDWTYLVCKWDGTNRMIYVDGTNRGIDSNSPGNGDFSQRLFISDIQGSGAGYVGLIDEVRISNISRSTSSIETTYNNLKNINSFLSIQSEETGPGPVGYWTFDEGHGTTAYDQSGQGNDGTITGAAWQSEDMCVSGKCLYFDGVDDYVEVGDFDL